MVSVEIIFKDVVNPSSNCCFGHTGRQKDGIMMASTCTHPEKYPLHAHKTEFSEKSWIGLFLAREAGQ
ncbi:MAG: hypothetical protein WAO91_05875 [Candidatus Nitrosotenuis sp.]